MPPGAVDSAARVLERAAENRMALATTGSTRIDLELLESQYAEIGGGKVEADDLRSHLLRAGAVYALAAVGRHRIHPDHAAVRDAVVRIRPDAVLYADQPYCVFPLDLDLAPALEGYERQVIDLSREEATRKARAVACYSGEVRRLEGLMAQLERPAEDLAYEVLWRPVSVRPIT